MNYKTDIEGQTKSTPSEATEGLPWITTMHYNMAYTIDQTLWITILALNCSHY